MARQADILPCPYCGNEYTVLPNAEIKTRPQYVYCALPPNRKEGDYCGACGPSCDTEEEAIERWNSGPQPRIEGVGVLTGVIQVMAVPGGLYALCKDGSVWFKNFYEGSGTKQPWEREGMQIKKGGKDGPRELTD